MVLATHDEQSTDLTGRPGTPSAVRRRVEARAKGPRSLLGPDAYHVGDGIHPKVTDVAELIDLEDRATDHGDPEDILRRLAEMRAAAGLAAAPVAAESVVAPAYVAPVATAESRALAAAVLDLPPWDEPEEPNETPAGAPSRTRTDPFGLNLPTDEVDMMARAGATMPDRFERSFFERETQPIPRGTAPFYIPQSNTAAAIAVIAFGLVAVVSLTLSAWIALSTPAPTASAGNPDVTLPYTPNAPSHGGSNGFPPPPPAREVPADAVAPEPTIADLPT